MSDTVIPLNEIGKIETVKVYNQAYVDEQQNRIEQLEEENAELKERLKEHESVGNEQFWENVWSWKTKALQLTKAKEIIRDLLSCLYAVEYDHISDLEEAEQFLKEVEK